MYVQVALEFSSAPAANVVAVNLTDWTAVTRRVQLGAPNLSHSFVAVLDPSPDNTVMRVFQSFGQPDVGYTLRASLDREGGVAVDAEEFMADIETIVSARAKNKNGNSKNKGLGKVNTWKDVRLAYKRCFDVDLDCNVQNDYKIKTSLKIEATLATMADLEQSAALFEAHMTDPPEFAGKFAAGQPFALPAGQVCANCGAAATELKKLLKCSRCMEIEYCSAACQKKDWRRHKKGCGK